MSYFKSPYILEIHAKIFTDEKNDFWGLLDRAHGRGRNDPGPRAAVVKLNNMN